MKKYIYILLSMWCLSGCSNMLDIDSQMSLDANQELKTEDVDKLLNGLYAAIVNSNNYSYCTNMYPEYLSDNLKLVNPQFFQIQDAYNHEILEDDILNYYNYPDLYKGIYRANTILGVPSASESQKAIAKYCRAYNYIRLIDLYGAVPIIDENYDKQPIQRSSEKKVMEFIVSDLLDAKAHAPEFNTNTPEANTKPTKEAAQALLARVYRMQGRLDLAGQEAESLITSGKFSLSDNPAEKDKEVIMYFATLTSSTSNAGWGYIMSWEARNWNCLAVADEVVALLKGNDTRKILYELDEAADRKGYVFPSSAKYKNTENWDSEFYVSRLPEMYLISAEAGNSNRLTEFQAKRKSSLTLKEERRLELALEFVRWRDQKMEGETYLMPFPKESIAANPLLRGDILE